MPEEIKQQIIKFFLDGESVNHIVFLLHYKYRIDAVSTVLREALRSALLEIAPHRRA